MDLALKGIATAASGLGAVVSVRQHANLIRHQFAGCETMADYLPVWWKLDESNFLAVNTAAFLIVIALASGTFFMLGLAGRIRKFLRRRREHAASRQKAHTRQTQPARSRKKARPKVAAPQAKRAAPNRAAS
jgi:hypothetical protein